MLAPVIERVLHRAYFQVGLQRLNLRYYPLPVEQARDSAVLAAHPALSDALVGEYQKMAQV